MKKKLIKVKYMKIEGKLKAIELYDDNSTRLVEIKEGIVNYILTGKEKCEKQNKSEMEDSI